MLKDALSALAIAITLYAFLPYIRSVHAGTTKPHVFSWVIWGASTFVVFFAQLADSGGAGAWPIGISGAISLYVAGLAYAKRADISITRTDWLFFALAASSLPLWYLTSDPLWAVVILTFADTLGFAPTFRKAYARPFEEQVQLYVLLAIRNTIALVALENYSLTTMLFPGVIAATCAIFVVMVVQRRRAFA